MGGLSRKATLIKTTQEKQDIPSLLVDSGNLLFNKTSLSTQSAQKRLTAETILEIYQSMGFGGVAVGPYDLAAGLEFLLASQKNGFPWLSANLLDKDKKPLFHPSLIQTVGDLKIGLIGLTGKTTRPNPLITLAPYQDVLPQEVKTLAKQTDFVILLSSLTQKENTEISARFDAVNLIVTAIKNNGNSRPKLINNTLVCQTRAQGKVQGVLTINPGNHSTWAQDDKKQLFALRNRLGSYDWQLKRLKKHGSTPENKTKIQQLANKKKKVMKQLDHLKEQIAYKEMNNLHDAIFQAQFLSLKGNVPQDAAISKQIIALKYKIKNHNKKIRKEQKSIRERKKLSPLVGFKVCEECHEEQVQAWQKSGHANAYTTLVQKEQNFNLDCLGCHVTTATNPQHLTDTEKQALFQLGETLRLVGCESCHGPGRAHAADPETVPPIKISENTCLQCHTEEHSEQFHFQEKIKEIRCPAS